MVRPKRKMPKIQPDSTVSSESIISLICVRPEIWDDSKPCYNNKKLKAKSWDEIAKELDIPLEQAKSRWAGLRNVFRKQLRKVVKASKETGNLDTYVPSWKYFKDMQFLQDLMLNKMLHSRSSSSGITNGEDGECIDDEDVEDSNPSLPSTIHGDSGDEMSEPEIITEVISTNDNNHQTYSLKKRKRFNNDVSLDREFVNGHQDNTDADYHFFMSILPSIRNISHERKNILRMKILQLIIEAEGFDIAE